MIQLFSAVISVAAFFIYLFGLSSEAKHKVDRQIVTTFGRNKFSETLKKQVWRLPDKKKEPVKQLKHDIKKVAGKVKNTPVGKTTGHYAGQAGDFLGELGRTVLDRLAELIGISKDEHKPEQKKKEDHHSHAKKAE